MRSPAVRYGIAMGVALLADTIGLPFGELGVVVFDVGVALVLALCIGWKWELAVALILEAIPGVGVFSFWSLVVPILWWRQRKVAATDNKTAGPPL